jgi:membrane fusion protein, multidrug efflux system
MRLTNPILVLTLILLLSAPPLASQSAREVQAFEVVAAAIERRSQVQGEVFPLESMRVVPRVSGYIAKIHVREGSVVARGALLASLDAPELAHDKSVADAMVEKAKALLTVAKSAVLAATEAKAVAVADDRAATSQTEVAQSVLAVSRANYDRAKRLHAGRAATEEEWEAAQLDLTKNKSGLLSAQSAQGATAARVEQAAAHVALREAEVVRAGAGVTVAAAQAARAAAFAGFARLENPYTRARVTRQLVDAGTLAMAQETEILELMNISKVRIRFGVPQADASYVEPGSSVTIVIPDSVRDDVTATVTRVAGAVMPGSRNMYAEVELDNADGKWLPGTIVKVDLEIENAAKAIVIPSRAVFHVRAESFVWVVDAGKARRVRVKPGGVVGRGKVRILSGVADGAQVLVAGLRGLKDGVELNVQKVEK